MYRRQEMRQLPGDTKDFVFENNYDTPIYIFGEIDDDNQLCFAIYGKETRDKTRKIEFESEEVSTEEPGVKYKADAELALGEDGSDRKCTYGERSKTLEDCL